MSIVLIFIKSLHGILLDQVFKSEEGHVAPCSDHHSHQNHGI